MDQQCKIWAIRQLDAMTQPPISIIDGAIFEIKDRPEDFSISAYTKSPDATDFSLTATMIIDKPSKIDRFFQKLFREKTAGVVMNWPKLLQRHKTLTELSD